MGHTIDDGSYQEVTSGTKKALTISYYLTGVKTEDGKNGIVSGTITPTLSKYKELHNKILGQDIPGQTSIYSYEYTDVNDESEFNLKFNAGVSYVSPTVSGSVKAGFEFPKTNSRNKYMVKFMQTFYTVDIDQGEWNIYL